MAKRGSKVLEWVSEQVDLQAAAANQRVVINLNLDDDEIAEIHKIESEIRFTTAAQLDDQEVDTQHMLSMDPSVSIADNPYSEAQYEDLETLYSFVCQVTIDGNGTAGSVDQNLRNTAMKQYDSPQGYPILVATNLGFLIQPDTDAATRHNIRIWFTRRRAVGNELARTLLKRR